MRKNIMLFICCAAGLMSCSPDMDASTGITKEEVAASQGKMDGSASERICKSLGLSLDCDVCEAMHWYSDSSCDTFCVKPDPDCNIATEATVTVKSQAMRGYYVYVDDILIGQDGTNGDPQDGLYTFKVSGNQEHLIRVYDSQYTYSTKIFFNSGETRTLNVEPEQPVNKEVLVIVKSNNLRNYMVYIDEQLIGQEGTNGDVVDGVYTFKVKGGMYHMVRVTTDFYNYSQMVKFNDVGTFTITLEPTVNPKPTSTDSEVTVNFHGAMYYKIYVDNVEIGTEGSNGDVPDGIYNFKVPGNQYHLIRVSEGLYEYSKSLYFQAGAPMTIDVYKEGAI